jgi:CDP-glycerol glycerophosphotransferase
MPEGIEYCPLRMSLNYTVSEHREFVKFLGNPKKKVSGTLVDMFKRELHRAFNGFPFDAIIHFNGYGIEETMLFSISDAKKTIWVHNDMVQELKSKDNQNLSVLKHVYNTYDNVAVVSPDLIKPTSEISGRKDNIRIIHNVNNIEEIKRKGLRDIEVNESCVITTKNSEGIQGVLNSPGKKFITIGRFSPEKGHKRLISAFNKYCEDYPDTQLIIIGGYGPSYDETLALAGESNFADNITIIKSILNPMPILKECDLFVVSSFYEGWPMVIMEADAFDIPVIATDITGTQWSKEYGAYIVENSEEGVLKGMYDFSEGKVNALGIDYDEYNRRAIDEFIDIL